MSDAARDSEVLRRRAAQLARPAATAWTAAAGVQVLEFSVGEQRCLLAIDYLREVRALRELLSLPQAPASLLGLVQLRGRMLPVVDIADLLGQEPMQAEPDTRLLVIGREAPAFGVAAGAVQGLHQLRPEEVERRSALLDTLRPESVRGATADGRLLLDGERLLTLHRSARP